jgi:hypothetical protein
MVDIEAGCGFNADRILGIGDRFHAEFADWEWHV